VLTGFDDYPIHQTPEPVAHPATGDRNFYDRYFFDGWTPDGGLYFAAALGVYPNRSVIDASFSVVRGGEQISLHASGRAPQERLRTQVGPIEVRVEEPMRRLALRVGPNASGLEGELVFEARSAAVEEPRFTAREGGRVLMDSTRFTQWGGWRGWLAADGERLSLAPEAVLGARDRSWGVRRVGEAEGGAPSTLPPQFFWLWAPLHFGDFCTHFDVNEDGEGRPWHWNGNRIPALARAGGGDPAALPAAERMAAVSHRIDWEPGTRRARRAEIVLAPLRGEPLRIELEPIVTFQMLGIGYLHPEWGHGLWKGESASASERWKLSELNPLDPRHLHVQQLCRARCGPHVGSGVLEQLVIGPHAPSGLAGVLDGATPGAVSAV
jgi:hypothetical protein